MSQCNSSSTCCSNENDCQSTASASSPCPCPIEFAVEKWSDAFFSSSDGIAGRAYEGANSAPIRCTDGGHS